MSDRWIKIGDTYVYQVEQLTTEGLYSRYASGSGQGVAVDINSLNQNLSLSEIADLQELILSQNLPDGTHNLTLQNVGANFAGAEKDTIGGLRVDLNLEVNTLNGATTVVGGAWSQHRPDTYNFLPLWSEHRSLAGNLATVFQHAFDTVAPPWTESKPFPVFVLGERDLVIEPHCFLAGTEITMADGLKKPIEEIQPNDWVQSFDEKTGELKPGRVTRTFTNEAKIILDFHGTFVTPGHVYYCAGGKYEGKFAPLIDILRDDGVIQHEDGTLIRVSTGCEIGSVDDTEFWAFTAYEDTDGSERIRDKKKLRLGTRWMLPNGHHFTMREYMEGSGLELLEDGYVRFKETGLKTIFVWTFSDTLPNPEDFVLSRSQTSLEDIYSAGQWEALQPSMPAPLRRDSGPVAPMSEHQLDAMPRNIPLAFENETPSSGLASQRPRMNRKQRKAHEAKMRAAAKAERSATMH